MKVIGKADSSLEDGVLDDEFTDIDAVIETEVVAEEEAKPVAAPQPHHKAPHRKPEHKAKAVHKMPKIQNSRNPLNNRLWK